MRVIFGVVVATFVPQGVQLKPIKLQDITIENPPIVLSTKLFLM